MIFGMSFMMLEAAQPSCLVVRTIGSNGTDAQARDIVTVRTVSDVRLLKNLQPLLRRFFVKWKTKWRLYDFFYFEIYSDN